VVFNYILGLILSFNNMNDISLAVTLADSFTFSFSFIAHIVLHDNKSNHLVNPITRGKYHETYRFCVTCTFLQVL